MFNGEIFYLLRKKTWFLLYKKPSGFLYEVKKPYVNSVFISVRPFVRYATPETKPFVRFSQISALDFLTKTLSSKCEFCKTGTVRAALY